MKIFFKCLVLVLIGFMIASHWDVGRRMVQQVSPLYNSKFQKGMVDMAEGLKETGKIIKHKVAD